MALADKGLIKITSGGHSMTFAPKSCRVSHTALSTANSGRNNDGDMYIEWVTNTSTPAHDFYAVPSLEIELPPHRIDDPLYSKILSHVVGQTYYIEYYDTMQHLWETTAMFYTADTTSDWYSGVVLDGIVQGETFTATGMYNHSYNRFNPSQLATPVASISGTSVTWNAVAGAAKYRVNDNGTMTEKTTRSHVVTSDVRHNVSVKALSDGSKLDSEWSNVVTYAPPHKLDTPQIIDVEEDEDCVTFHWNVILDSAGYLVEDNGVQHEVYGNLNTSYSTEEMQIAHTVRVKARAANHTYDSDWSEYRTWTPAPQPVRYTLSLFVAPTGAGTVTGAGQYEAGATASITATANSGYRFTRWTLNGSTYSTNASTTINMDSDKALIAEFETMPALYTLTLNMLPDSSVGTVTGAGQYELGDEVRITATPAGDNTFVEWQYNGETYSTATNPKITITGNMTFTAVFARPTVPHTVRFHAKVVDKDNVAYSSDISRVVLIKATNVTTGESTDLYANYDPDQDVVKTYTVNMGDRVHLELFGSGQMTSAYVDFGYTTIDGVVSHNNELDLKVNRDIDIYVYIIYYYPDFGILDPRPTLRLFTSDSTLPMSVKVDDSLPLYTLEHRFYGAGTNEEAAIRKVKLEYVEPAGSTVHFDHWHVYSDDDDCYMYENPIELSMYARNTGEWDEIAPEPPEESG